MKSGKNKGIVEQINLNLGKVNDKNILTKINAFIVGILEETSKR